MFRIKICGVTTAADAHAAAEAGADAIGLNFYRHSQRCLSTSAAKEVAGAVPPGICKVGVFVNSPSDEICRIFDDLGLDFVQLHGDEPPEMLAQLGGRPVIRAFRVGDDTAPPRAYLERCRELGRLPQAVLLDAYQPGHYGGTGSVLKWDALRSQPDITLGLPLILAGGLTPANVDRGIRAVRPQAVDVASGVEKRPGEKDTALVAAFIHAARAAFEDISS